MEKYSAFRDPGTGIQPFLTPVPPVGSEFLARLVLPLGYVIGILRTTLILALYLIYITFVRGVGVIFIPVPPLHRLVNGILTSLVSRLVLLLVGLWWIPVELVTRKRGRAAKGNEPWNPRSGDIIVSNWVSWIEILWLEFRFSPTFVLPVCKAAEIPAPSSHSSTPITHTPGRRTGTGSAAISSPSRGPSIRQPIIGFQKVSVLSMLSATGHVPSCASGAPITSLEEIRRNANSPVVVFPECTTSNGRGMLRFADVFKGIKVPVNRFKVFVMCVRYDPPTNLSPTLTHSIPYRFLNPIPHLLKLASSLPPHPISIRLLAPSESPSSQLFSVSEVISNYSAEDVLSEVCATLIAQIGKMKRTGMGWEDKVAFLDFYKGKRR